MLLHGMVLRTDMKLWKLTCMVCILPCVVCKLVILSSSTWRIGHTDSSPSSSACQAVHNALATLTAVPAAVRVRQAAVLQAH